MSRKEIAKKASQKAHGLVENLRRQALSRKRKEATASRIDCGVWRRGLDQSSISGLQCPYAPETPIKRFLALTKSAAVAFFKNALAAGSAEKLPWRSLPPFAMPLSFHTLTYPCVTVLQSIKGRKNQLLRLTPTANGRPQSSSSSTMVVSDDGLTIKLSTAGYSKENISVEVESGWLVIEALATSAADTGGYLQRHMMRRYEIPPFSDVQNIKVELNEQTRMLKVHIPAIRPKIKG